MSRGITPVISVVLLLMMTVAVAGIAWFWLQGMTATLLNTTGETAERELCRAMLDLDFGGTTVYCSGSKIDAVGVKVAVDSGTGIVLKGMRFNELVVDDLDLMTVFVDGDLGKGEYKEIKIDNHGANAKYTGAALDSPGEEADFEIEIRTNCGKQRAIMTFDPGASNSVGC